MRHLMLTFVSYLIEFLMKGGGVSLGFDPSSRSILVAFSSQQTGESSTLNIDPRSLQEAPEAVVKHLCDCLTHNLRREQEAREYVRNMQAYREDRMRLYNRTESEGLFIDP